MDVLNKNVLIVGMGVSGVATACFLKHRGAHVTLSDKASEKELEPQLARVRGIGIQTELGQHRVETFLRADLIVVSPGVSHMISPLKQARDKGIEVIGEIELSARFITEPIIAITGTNGKTTTTIKLEQKLIKKGYRFKALNVDHYFFDLEFHPKDEFGDYDFETPQALDLPLINEHLVKISNGDKVLIPSYDFKTGTRTLDVTPMRLEKDELLLIDSLHGLYPDFSKDISSEVKFKLYLEPLLQMKGPDNKYVRWTDIRLIRRMLRDFAHRAYNPTQTLEHWHYVRSSEMRNIIPYSNTADFIISSAMPYELCFYSNKLAKDFVDWEKKYKGDPLKTDSYERASRLAELLKHITPVADDSPVPHDSVLREFIGGSSIVH